MPVHCSAPVRRGVLVALLALLLGACGTSAAEPRAASSPPSVDPVSEPATVADVEPPSAEESVSEGPYEVALIADFGPLPDGSGDAVVETTWTMAADGTRELVIDTPAGYAAHHVMTDDEHWFWIAPAARDALVDAEWVHFDLREIEAVGGELPEVVAEARVPVPAPGEITTGSVIAGHEVLAVDEVGDDEVHLTMDGIDEPVVHRRRALPADTSIEIPTDALDVSDLPEALRW